jgi:hypothetical protein
MIDIRLRNHIADAELEAKVGKILTPDDVNLMAIGPTRCRKPDGSTLFVYLPGALDERLRAAVYPTLHGLRSQTTTNRGMASGTQRVAPRKDVKRSAPGNRTRSKAIRSAIIGAFDPIGPQQYCRLTAWTGQETEKFTSLFPMFERIGGLMEEHARDRWAAQMAYAERTRDEWRIPGTPFTTITVNNTYPTGVHTDKGDLDEGISTIACLRRGQLDGGWLCFPRYRIGVDLQDGDVILMDAHEWHGNTALETHSEDAERISVVCYYRTRMADCGSLDEEEARRLALNEKRAIATGD